MQMPAQNITVETTMTACAGACTSLVLQQIGMVASCYEPGVQDSLLRDVRLDPNGSTLLKVENWIANQLPELQRLGYRINARRVAQPPSALREWVSAGKGHRAAVLSTDRMQLHPGSKMSGSHAVALVIRNYQEAGREGVVMIDPWPFMSNELDPPATLDAAHRARNYATLIFFWAGYS